MFNSITAKIIGIVMLGCLVMTIGIIWAVNHEMHHTIDTEEERFYREKLAGILTILEDNYASLEKSGLLKAYEEDSKKDIVQQLRVKYYGEAEASTETPDEVTSDSPPNTIGEKIYPFILDKDGLIVMHPALEDGSDAVANYDFIKKIYQGDKGDFDYVFKNENKWMIFDRFAGWDWVVAFAVPHRVKYAEANAFRNTLILISAGFGLLFVGGVSFFVFRTVIRPIRMTVDMLRDIAEGEGDLTKRLAIANKDELGQLATYFNRFVDKIQQIIQKIAVNARTLSESSNDMSATSNQVASAIEQMSRQSASVSTAATALTQQMNRVSSSTEEASNNVRVVASSVEEMTASIREVAQNAEQAANVAGQAASLAETSNTNIHQLDEAAGEIGKVLEVISDIAEQTNLLALNATIEAARAGDAGKGFAVVAHEVKDLARQTASATEDIAKRVSAIQGSTGETVKSIESISQVIEEVNKFSRSIASAVEEQSITTNEISQNISQVAGVTENVSKDLVSSTTTTQEISQNITGIDAAVQETSQGAGQTSRASESLNQLSQELQGLVSQFKI